MNVDLQIGLFNISAFRNSSQEYSDSSILVARLIYSFIVSCSYHATATSFSVFYFYYRLKKKIMLIPHENLLAVTWMSYQYGLGMSNNVTRK